MEDTVRQPLLINHQQVCRRLNANYTRVSSGDVTDCLTHNGSNFTLYILHYYNFGICRLDSGVVGRGVCVCQLSCVAKESSIFIRMTHMTSRLLRVA